MAMYPNDRLGGVWGMTPEQAYMDALQAARRQQALARPDWWGYDPARESTESKPKKKSKMILVARRRKKWN